MSEALFTILAERLEKLADAIAANSMPADERLWSKESIATYLGCSPSQVAQRIVNLKHSTKIDTLNEALRALGKRLDIRVA